MTLTPEERAREIAEKIVEDHRYRGSLTAAITAALLAEREAENEACEKVCAQIATNAERRYAGYADDEVKAKRAALDKLEAAHQCTLAIRARRSGT